MMTYKELALQILAAPFEQQQQTVTILSFENEAFAARLGIARNDVGLEENHLVIVSTEVVEFSEHGLPIGAFRCDLKTMSDSGTMSESSIYLEVIGNEFGFHPDYAILGLPISALVNDDWYLDVERLQEYLKI